MSLNGFLERVLVGRWIAGVTIDDAINRSKEINKTGIKTTINNLGEQLRDNGEVKSSVNTYIELIRAIKKNKISADIAVKVTEIGLLISMSTAKQNYRLIVDTANRNGIFVWLDMEEANHVSATIEIYKTMLRSGNVGICIQSYLKRSAGDIKSLVKLSAIVRLVKGAYKEDEKIAYQTREGTTANYFRLMEYLFENSKTFTIASHDSTIMKKALELNKKYKRNVTYAMLNGIKNNYALRLAHMHNNVELYVPFGSDWLGYSYRRLKEASHITLVIRSLFEHSSF